MKSLKKIALFLVLVAVIYAGLQAWDDEKLFTTTVGGAGKANVILIQDKTGSMCSVIYHPDFDRNISLSSYDNVDLPRSTTNFEGIGQTSWYLRWVYGTRIRSASGRVRISSWNETTNVLRVNNKTTYIREGDWILQYRDNDSNRADDDIEFDIDYQMVAKVTNVASNSDSNYTDLTLDASTILGTPTVNYYIDICSYNSSSYTTKIVKLYGSTLDQGDYRVSYAMDQMGGENTYLQWIFGVATDTQRQQITDFSTLAYDVEYNGYLRATPVSPANAYALNPDNSNSSETLLAEWNRVMKAIYPNKIANLNMPLTTTTATFTYKSGKDSLAGYLTTPFYIKIDAESMRVDSHTLDANEDGSGSFTVTRHQKNTVAAAHSTDAAIMIYNDEGLGIDEYTPLTHLFSSMQHVTESTGNVDPTWTETKNVNGTNRTCWRYKRVFTRIQTAREAMCDVVTAKNKLFSVADLAAAATDADTTLVYCNVNPDFIDRVAPFYIKVTDPNDTSYDEVMLVTAHDKDTMTLTVTRGQQGTDACSHSAFSKVMTYSGARDLVRFGFFVFPETDLQGGITSRLLQDSSNNYVGDLNDYGQKNDDGTYKTESYINTRVLDNIAELTASGSTPLAKALAQVWNYLKPNNNNYDAANPYSCYIRQNSSGWEAVDHNTFGTAEKFETIDGVTHPKGSPMEYWCQENFAVLVTDGDATADSDFNDSHYGVFSQTINKTANAGNVVSDFFKFDFNRSSYPSAWGDTSNDSEDANNEFLPDTAFFLSHQDLFPTSRIVSGTWSTTDRMYTTGSPVADAKLYSESDSDPRKKWPGNQNINTYTVGLCIANPVLEKAAKNGNGVNFTAFNYRDLADAFQTIVSSVSLLQEPMTYTTYAAPKQSITGGKYGYVAHFNPRERAVWEGHIRRFLLDDDGDFPENIDDPEAKVMVNGVATTSFQWDAVTRLNLRSEPRVVYTAKKVDGAWTRLDFMGSGITYADMDVASAQAAQVKKFTQNLVNADGSVISEYANFKLGETFHFNPQLVGYPLKWKASFDDDYKSFYDHFSDDNDDATPPNPYARKEVLYAGANDGKAHCFDASSGDELWSFIPNSQLDRLKIPALNPLLTGSHTYFVDGKAVVRDIKVSSTYTGDEAWRNWRTGLFFGMGIGGRSYCALDVTNPDDPKVLWEFDDGYDASSNPEGRMGFTESKPIVVDMNAGTYGQFPGVLLAGGYNEPEIAVDTSLPYLDWQKREGKALYVLDARDGTLVKKFIPGTGTGTEALGYLDGLKYAVTCAPVAFDRNNDGIADAIYFAESGDPVVANNQGGRIWKMNCFGSPLYWTAHVIYQAPAGQTIFIPPTLAYDDSFRLWIMFGTGRRPQAAYGSGGVFTNLTGQFVAFIDDNTSAIKTNDDLDNVTADIQTAPTPDIYDLKDTSGTTVSQGFYFNFFSDTNEIMFEPSPLYVGYQVYFMTFSPHEGEGSTGSTDDPCGGTSSVGGKHYIYSFKLTSQGNTFIIGDFMAQSGKILGYGPMEDKWKPYFGDGEAGNFEPNPTPPVELDNIFGPMLWKEDKK